MGSGGGGGSGDQDAIVINLCDSILNDVPDEFDVRQAEIDYPVMYNESMNTVLT